MEFDPEEKILVDRDYYDKLKVVVTNPDKETYALFYTNQWTDAGDVCKEYRIALSDDVNIALTNRIYDLEKEHKEAIEKERSMYSYYREEAGRLEAEIIDMNKKPEKVKEKWWKLF